MVQLTLPSWQIEKTLIGYREKSANFSPGTNKNGVLALTLASVLVRDLWFVDRAVTPTRTVIADWAHEFRPERVEAIDELYSDKSRALKLARLAFATCRPGGTPSPSELLIAIEDGSVHFELYRPTYNEEAESV